MFINRGKSKGLAALLFSTILFCLSAAEGTSCFGLSDDPHKGQGGGAVFTPVSDESLVRNRESGGNRGPARISELAETTADSEGDDGAKKKHSIYSVFVNVVSEDFRVPLFGFVNIARGDHNLPQFGLANWNTGTFGSAQVGLLNTTGGDTRGAQTGLVNTIRGGLNGAQVGLVNTAAGQLSGAQVGLANITKELRGVQVGLINYADSAEKGLPMGLISIVRHGGYRALELSFAETMPLNMTFKIGLEKFYTSWGIAYDPDVDETKAAFGFIYGAGSIIPVTEEFFINPELNNTTTFELKQHFVSFSPQVGYKLGSHLSIVAGPSLSYMYVDDGSHNTNPVFTLGKELSNGHSLLFGVKAGIRLQF
ncbi:MAG: hypothetical protein LBO65_11055 [Spirochaetaceae bacterium]|nr:hypothetical protein [Spirochaetaceae bacterium]